MYNVFDTDDYDVHESFSDGVLTMVYIGDLFIAEIQRRGINEYDWNMSVYQKVKPHIFDDDYPFLVADLYGLKCLDNALYAFDRILEIGMTEGVDFICFESDEEIEEFVGECLEG